MPGLKTSEIHWIVNSYIGVSEGYLGDLSYRTHREFYAAHCDLEIDPEAVPGKTTREKFLSILGTAQPRDQGAILRGIAHKYPVGSDRLRTEESYKTLMGLAKRCTDVAAVETPTPALASELVRHALQDATALLEQRGPVSALDRVHTALHAYLKAACSRSGIETVDQATMTSLLKQLRQQHPCFKDGGQHNEAVGRILQSLSNVVDSLNPLRNQGSLAHPNTQLVTHDEAILAINASRTVIQYLDAKFSNEEPRSTS